MHGVGCLYYQRIRLSLTTYYFVFRYLIENQDWLKEQLGEDDDDYILFDLPGQIELYTHMKTVKQLAELLQNWGFNVCSVMLVDSQFMVDGPKFISGKYLFIFMYLIYYIIHFFTNNCRYYGCFIGYDKFRIASY